MGDRKESLFSLQSLTLKLALSVTFRAKREDGRLFQQLVFCPQSSLPEQFMGLISSGESPNSHHLKQHLGGDQGEKNFKL